MSFSLQDIEAGFRTDTSGKSSFAEDGMVATQSPHATSIGKAILRQGGNAVDAAVAAAIALGVAEPQASGLGGQTMMLIGDDKTRIAIDGSSRAPSLAHANSIYRYDRSVGYRATTVPSTPAALGYAHESYGRLRWREILEPSIALARDGYPVSTLQNRLLTRELPNFQKVPSGSGTDCFYKDGKPYGEGETFRQPALAETLRVLAEKGFREFYRGVIAKRIDADMRENGGLLRYDDLALIPFPIERKPLETTFRGLCLATMPPPGAGRTLIYALNMLDHIEKDNIGYDDNHLYHIIINIIRRAFLERADRPHDPHFFPQISDASQMLDKSFAYEGIREIIEDVDRKLLPVIPSEDEISGETTHLSVIDKEGLGVSLTQSIERVYGSKAVASGLGFIYNNYLYDFEYTKPEHPYYLRPNGNPWATVAPSLLYQEDKLWMALGSPGSERIVSTLILFLLRITDFGFSIDRSMRAPRLHCSLGGRVSLEAGRFDPSLVDYLKGKEYRIDLREDYSFYLGCIQAVLKRSSGRGFQGVADVRRDGTAE